MKNSDQHQHSILSQLHQDFSIKQPIFFVGAERSGTTLFSLMLEHHPQVTWCNEFEYAVDLVSDASEFPCLDNYYDWLSLHRIFQMRSLLVLINSLNPRIEFQEVLK